MASSSCWASTRRRRSASLPPIELAAPRDRKSTRLNSSHRQISYAVFCLKNKTIWSVERDHATIGLYDVRAYPDDVILVIGSELAGLSHAILQRPDAVIGIPMYAVNHSFP